ncbi:MAG: twin-arginine translocase subunit TatC [Flavobacteriales bacterium]|jgi:sec-independent protein translocase protein TatC|uniref:twin-arginine translocase subunit TatC n=1 Tax=Blattabacterium sp. (Mastotermes darwiniensis) TaxID=39768 RepID=UPI000231DFA9|nr:twin-arginine translocase subunit TatC [Blattabacterium sp. (Mastotermes darwiniensis)]AER40449.1 Sec-independent protein translocase protein TatC, putative [Blattabacterium sp. (Mastotermes darwiniensis) str. MADAR]MDR1805035.1 twin-arginine translocase subunit TatC [Flavobacteriales bacterium]
MKNEKKEMLFWEHIEELRKHMIHSLCAIIIAMIILMNNQYVLFDYILFGPAKTDFITYRILKNIFFDGHYDTIPFFSKNLEIQNRQIFGQFNMYVWTCLIGGVILSFPYVFYEFWKFIKPALSDEERKYSRGIIFMVTFLFVLGIFFGYFVLCPFLINFGYTFRISSFPKNIFDLSDYISLMMNSMLSMGFTFLFPLFIYFLTKIGLISYTFLKEYRKHAFLIILIIASAITPGDILSTIIVLIPLLILYQLSLYISRKS